MYVWTTECLEHGYSVVLNHFVLHLFSIVDTQKVIRYLEGTVQTFKLEIVRKGRDGYRDYENAAKSRNYADESMDASFA